MRTEAKTRKEVLRSRLLCERNQLSLSVIAAKSSQIAKRFFSLADFSQAKTIGLYSATNNEVTTDSIFSRALADLKEVAYPRVTSKIDKQMAFYQVSSLADLRAGYRDILEPAPTEKSVIAAELDLLCVPGVGFSLQGQRIGFGHGYFDKWLKDYHGTRVGLAFEFQIVDVLPTENWDQNMDLIITEERVVECGRVQGN